MNSLLTSIYNAVLSECSIRQKSVRKSVPQQLTGSWNAGLVLKQSSSDNSLHVKLHKTLQIACQGSIAAFQSSELSSGDSAQPNAALLAAVATASSTKAAEIQKLVAALQKVWLEIENPILIAL